MKLVVTDGATLSGGGVSLDIFSQFGEVQIYDLTAPEQLAERVSDADGILCNKTPIPAELFDRCPKLRYVGECATGYNNIDIAAAKAHGVTVCNVAGYSTDAVAQHTFALILHHYSRVAQYDAAVRQGAWKQAKTFCIMPYPMQELAGKTLAMAASAKRLPQLVLLLACGSASPHEPSPRTAPIRWYRWTKRSGRRTFSPCTRP